MSKPIAQRGLAALYRRIMALDEGRRAVRWAFQYPHLTNSIVAIAKALGVDANSPGRLVDAMRPPLRSDHFSELIDHAKRNEVAVAGRVVVVCGTLAPGGAERQAANTAIALAHRPGLHVSVACDWLTPNRPERYDFYRAAIEDEGIAVGEFPRPSSKALAAEGLSQRVFSGLHRTFDPLLLDDILGCYMYLRQERPAIVHAFLDWSNVRAGVAAAMAGVPRIVLSGRNLNPSHFLLHADYMKPAYEALLDHPGLVLTNNSEAGARDYASWLDQDPASIPVIRNGLMMPKNPINRLAARRALEGQLGIPKESPLVGGMFRLSEEKRPLLWIEAAARIANNRPDVRFVLFGTGPLADDVCNCVRELGLKDRIVLPGLTDAPHEALAAMDLLMMTSWAEGTPNVVLEAQWLGTPVVVTAGGGSAEALHHGVTGLLVEEADEEGVAAAALKVLAGNLALGAGCSGRAFVNQQFGLERMASDTITVYGDALRGDPQ